ncbi:hypothetical protein J6590_052663 [Homalodisca vitripennis]|nr:hypothetical protein J6590_052663 [Homalodisca vitripennis]
MTAYVSLCVQLCKITVRVKLGLKFGVKHYLCYLCNSGNHQSINSRSSYQDDVRCGESASLLY